MSSTSSFAFYISKYLDGKWYANRLLINNSALWILDNINDDSTCYIIELDELNNHQPTLIGDLSGSDITRDGDEYSFPMPTVPRISSPFENLGHTKYYISIQSDSLVLGGVADDPNFDNINNLSTSFTITQFNDNKWYTQKSSLSPYALWLLNNVGVNSTFFICKRNDTSQEIEWLHELSGKNINLEYSVDSIEVESNDINEITHPALLTNTTYHLYATDPTIIETIIGPKYLIHTVSSTESDNSLTFESDGSGWYTTTNLVDSEALNILTNTLPNDTFFIAKKKNSDSSLFEWVRDLSGSNIVESGNRISFGLTDIYGNNLPGFQLSVTYYLYTVYPAETINFIDRNTIIVSGGVSEIIGHGLAETFPSFANFITSTMSKGFEGKYTRPLGRNDMARPSPAPSYQDQPLIDTFKARWDGPVDTLRTSWRWYLTLWDMRWSFTFNPSGTTLPYITQSNSVVYTSDYNAFNTVTQVFENYQPTEPVDCTWEFVDSSNAIVPSNITVENPINDEIVDFEIKSNSNYNTDTNIITFTVENIGKSEYGHVIEVSGNHAVSNNFDGIYNNTGIQFNGYDVWKSNNDMYLFKRSNSGWTFGSSPEDEVGELYGIHLSVSESSPPLNPSDCVQWTYFATDTQSYVSSNISVNLISKSDHYRIFEVTTDINDATQISNTSATTPLYVEKNHVIHKYYQKGVENYNVNIVDLQIHAPSNKQYTANTFTENRIDYSFTVSNVLDQGKWYTEVNLLNNNSTLALLTHSSLSTFFIAKKNSRDPTQFDWIHELNGSNIDKTWGYFSGDNSTSIRVDYTDVNGFDHPLLELNTTYYLYKTHPLSVLDSFYLVNTPQLRFGDRLTIKFNGNFTESKQYMICAEDPLIGSTYVSEPVPSGHRGAVIREQSSSVTGRSIGQGGPYGTNDFLTFTQPSTDRIEVKVTLQNIQSETYAQTGVTADEDFILDGWYENSIVIWNNKSGIDVIYADMMLSNNSRMTEDTIYLEPGDYFIDCGSGKASSSPEFEASSNIASVKWKFSFTYQSINFVVDPPENACGTNANNIPLLIGSNVLSELYIVSGMNSPNKNFDGKYLINTTPPHGSKINNKNYYKHITEDIWMWFNNVDNFKWNISDDRDHLGTSDSKISGNGVAPHKVIEWVAESTTRYWGVQTINFPNANVTILIDYILDGDFISTDPHTVNTDKVLTVRITGSVYELSPSSYQWQYQMSDYPLWIDIVGETNSTYTTKHSDNQKYIRCVVNSNDMTGRVLVKKLTAKSSRMNSISVNNDSLKVELKGKTNIASNREKSKDGFRQNGKVKNTINFISI